MWPENKKLNKNWCLLCLRYDLIVIGAGPGGYVAAIRAAELGMKTACVEKDPGPGGVCLNVGCIPSKALLESTENYQHGEKPAGRTRNPRGGGFDRSCRVNGAKAKDSHRPCGQCPKTYGKRRGAADRGSARLKSPGEVEVTSPDGGLATYSAGAVLLATGSEPVELPFLPFDEKLVVSSTGALAFDSVPERLGIVGGGYIGLELGSVWARLGSRVTVIELLPRIAYTLDAQVGGSSSGSSQSRGSISG